MIDRDKEARVIDGAQWNVGREDCQLLIRHNRDVCRALGAERFYFAFNFGVLLAHKLHDRAEKPAPCAADQQRHYCDAKIRH
jgi:hypothetical protein